MVLEQEYIVQISSRLRNFKRKNENLYNFSCPFCGDSKKKKTKARGYLYVKGNNFFFKCFNCNYGTTFPKFLEKIDYELYKDFQMKMFFEKKSMYENIYVPTPKIFLQDERLEFFDYETLHLDTILDLPAEHYARQYITKRKIPAEYYSRLYFAPDFKKFVDELIPNHKYNLLGEDPRIVIPFFNRKKKIVAVQGRSLNTKSKVKYLTIKVKDEPKIFNFERVNLELPVYVLEGPFDSMFVRNSVAVAGSDLTSVRKYIKDPIFVFDNEPRNKEILKKMEKVIEQGMKIVIWPREVKEKDINEMVLAGVNFHEILEERTFSDIKAHLEFSFWRIKK